VEHIQHIAENMVKFWDSAGPSQSTTTKQPGGQNRVSCSNLVELLGKGGKCSGGIWSKRANNSAGLAYSILFYSHIYTWHHSQ